ncbi:hypothetical protein [Acidovorax sp. 100]|uniref:hypothetical protein n=1 Tax=Acidovorax sp. 100 TaxID=2135635 RepID=UPI0013149BCC|nr:hypothetical protein [Acidovorax sp. 100]
MSEPPIEPVGLSNGSVELAVPAYRIVQRIGLHFVREGRVCLCQAIHQDKTRR